MQQYDFPNKPNLDLNISPKLIVYALGVILLLWLASGIYIVNPEEQAVVMRFGQAIQISDSGIHYHLPRPIERIEKEKVTQVKRIEIERDQDLQGRSGDLGAGVARVRDRRGGVSG